MLLNTTKKQYASKIYWQQWSALAFPPFVTSGENPDMKGHGHGHTTTRCSLLSHRYGMQWPLNFDDSYGAKVLDYALQYGRACCYDIALHVMPVTNKNAPVIEAYRFETFTGVGRHWLCAETMHVLGSKRGGKVLECSFMHSSQGLRVSIAAQGAFVRTRPLPSSNILKHLEITLTRPSRD